MNIRSIQIQSHGHPALAEHTPPTSSPHDAQVKMLASPINPVDLNIIDGRYAVQPPLPFVAGNEGVGIVESVGKNVTRVKVGDHVIFPYKTPDNWIGLWSERVVVNETQLLTIPKSVPIEQAAMATINPITAWLMLHRFVELNPGDWIIQNAANSGVGLWVNFIAGKLGLLCHNIRRQTENEPIPPRPYRLGLNGVGGESGIRVAKALAPGSPLVTYGAMSKEPLTIGNALLIYKDIRFVGFLRWRFSDRAILDPIYVTLFKWMSEIAVPVEARYSIDQFQDALAHAAKSGRAGKILLYFRDAA